jgi:hypothetical protein
MGFPSSRAMAAPVIKATAAETIGVNARMAPRIRSGVARGEVREAAWLMQMKIEMSYPKK